VTQACRWFGISRQAYYQALARQQRRQVTRELALALLRDVRHRHPNMGIRKVYHLLRPKLRSWGLSVGRDALFRLAREHRLLAPRRRNPRRTTRPGHVRHPNLLAQATLTAPGQAWVADILAVEGALQALTMAQESQPPHAPGCLHHSDHGIQYTARAYQAALQRMGLRPSMGRIGNAYDNALAERVIGTLKTEYGIEGPFPNESLARQALQEAVFLYNHERPHLSLAYATPAQIHFMSWRLAGKSVNV